MKKFEIKHTFKIKRGFRYPNRYKNKEISVAFDVSDDILNDWKNGRFTNGKALFKYLEDRFGGIDNFNLILIPDDTKEPFMIDGNNVYLNLLKYRKYVNEIDKFIQTFKISRYYFDLFGSFRKKIPHKFFDNNPPDKLFKEIDNTVFDIIEKMLMEFDALSDLEKEAVRKKIEYSPVVFEMVEKEKKIKKLTKRDYLRYFIKNIDKFDDNGVKKLLEIIFRSKKSFLYYQHISKLPLDIQKKILTSPNLAARMLNLIDELEKSLLEFKKLIKKHKMTKRKNEAGIHSFLADNYWLLGIEYFNQVIKTSINKEGKKVNETKFLKGRLIPDFEIYKIDGSVDECVVIEIEEANDPIINKDGTISKRVFDGINQAVMYTVMKKIEEGKISKGIAIVGSTGKLKPKIKKKFKEFSYMFPHIKIMTYEDIILRAEKVISFIKKYKETNIIK